MRFDYLTQAELLSFLAKISDSLNTRIEMANYLHREGVLDDLTEFIGIMYIYFTDRIYNCYQKQDDGQNTYIKELKKLISEKEEENIKRWMDYNRIS